MAARYGVYRLDFLAAHSFIIKELFPGCASKSRPQRGVVRNRFGEGLVGLLVCPRVHFFDAHTQKILDTGHLSLKITCEIFVEYLDLVVLSKEGVMLTFPLTGPAEIYETGIRVKRDLDVLL